VKLWLDDIRPAPPGWFPVRNADDFKSVMRSHQWNAVSFDHDLGVAHTLGLPSDEVTGYDLAVWMFDQGLVPATRPTVHSANPAGADRLRALISERWVGNCKHDSGVPPSWCGLCDDEYGDQSPVTSERM
jgi:hypothetical protein